MREVLFALLGTLYAMLWLCAIVALLLVYELKDGWAGLDGGPLSYGMIWSVVACVGIVLVPPALWAMLRFSRQR